MLDSLVVMLWSLSTDVELTITECGETDSVPAALSISLVDIPDDKIVLPSDVPKYSISYVVVSLDRCSLSELSDDNDNQVEAVRFSVLTKF